MKLYPEILSLTDEEVRNYPLTSFEGEIVLVQTLEQAEEAVAYLSSCPVLGFDTETKPSFVRGRSNRVAILQLSDARRAFIFQLPKIGLPVSVARILEDRSIIKVGAAIHDDIKTLARLQPFYPRGFVDLQQSAKLANISTFGLHKLAALLLGYRISKTMRLTNWEMSNLTHAQQLYAATDAWICTLVYQKFTTLGIQCDVVKYTNSPLKSR